jgi:hypothetical protein
MLHFGSPHVEIERGMKSCWRCSQNNLKCKEIMCMKNLINYSRLPMQSYTNTNHSINIVSSLPLYLIQA